MNICKGDLWFINNIVVLSRATTLTNLELVIKTMDGFKETIQPIVDEYIVEVDKIGELYKAQQAIVKEKQTLMNNVTGKKSDKVKKIEAIKEVVLEASKVMTELNNTRTTLDETMLDVTITKDLAQGTLELLEYLLGLNILDRDGRVGIGGDWEIKRLAKVVELLKSVE